MKYLKVILVLLWKLWFYILAILCTITIGTIIYLLTFQKNDNITYYFMRIWSYILFYGTGFSYSMSSSVELESKQNYIFTSNHTSLMDIALMFIIHPKHPIVFVGKKELESYPLFGRIYKKVSIVVDRADKNSRSAVFGLVKKELLHRNKSVVIFAEGGVPDRDIILGEFKKGAFLSSIYCKIPLVIYVFHGLKNMFPFVTTIGYPGKVKVERLDILFPENENLASLNEKAYQLIYEKIKDEPIRYPELK